MKIEAKYFKSIELFLEKEYNNHQEYVFFVASSTKINFILINNIKSKIFGAIFPQIIFKDKLYEEGLIAININKNMQIHLVKDIKDESLEDINLTNVKSLITIVEGFSSQNEKFLSKLFEKLEINTNIMGAGAGLIDDKSKAVIFDNNSFYKNSSILITLQNEINLGVNHGWEYLEGPYLVTSSENNILKSINHQNALKVYLDVIENDSGIKVNESNFSEITKSYPLEIIKYKDNQLVRDPIAFEDDNLVLVGEISNNTVINILKGKIPNLIKATDIAASLALKKDCEFVMIFDCITRKEFLGNRFKNELNLIYKKSNASTFIGAISIGEIANKGNNYINFLNKTCVIGGICY